MENVVIIIIKVKKIKKKPIILYMFYLFGNLKKLYPLKFFVGVSIKMDDGLIASLVFLKLLCFFPSKSRQLVKKFLWFVSFF